LNPICIEANQARKQGAADPMAASEKPRQTNLKLEGRPDRRLQAGLRRFGIRLKRSAGSRLFPEADRSSAILAGI
jgi:hypothetical protein